MSFTFLNITVIEFIYRFLLWWCWRLGNNKTLVPLPSALQPCVTMQQSPKTPKQGGNPIKKGPIPHSSGVYLLESSGIFCVATWIQTDWETGEGRRNEKGGSVRLTLVELLLLNPKDGSLKKCLPASMAVLRDWDCSASHHPTHGTNLPSRATKMVPQTSGRPPQEEKTGRREERRREKNGREDLDSSITPCQCPSQRTFCRNQLTLDHHYILPCGEHNKMSLVYDNCGTKAFHGSHWMMPWHLVDFI